MHTESVNISQGKRRSAAATTVVIEVPALPIDIKTPDAMWRKKTGGFRFGHVFSPSIALAQDHFYNGFCCLHSQIQTSSCTHWPVIIIRRHLVRQWGPGWRPGNCRSRFRIAIKRWPRTLPNCPQVIVKRAPGNGLSGEQGGFGRAPGSNQ